MTKIENITPISIEKDKYMNENTIEIKNSIISGLDGQNQYYEISSERTWNSINNKDIVEMTGISTKLLLKNGLEINIVGKSALFNNKTKQLKLESDIEISSNNKFEVFIQDIDIDINKSNLNIIELQIDEENDEIITEVYP